ncbi:hypothetical protein PR048_016077 [Dryococelus australis]|uniref:Integrase catalytic domain-containing protein n=1 Tax=Dryococelus australis TaxID=614101 RepID=A0ABQ9HIQ6_9NEOP|nr:hypothetical protein PR048_016077 [Dryococelus australis]
MVDLYNVVSSEFREGEQDTNWGKKDAKAQGYIVTTIDKGNIQFTNSCDSAKGMFDKLCSIYERDSSHNKSLLLQNFFNYKIDKVASSLSDLQNHSMKLKSVGYTVDDEMMMGKILSSLPDRLRHFLTAWESTPKSDRTLTNLTARLLAEEERGHTSSMQNNYHECVLKNVLYVPGLTINLISVHKITENGGVKFTDNGVEILKGRTKITGEKDNSGLYNINLNCSETILLSESKQTSDLNLWHRRIGNFNVGSMKKLATLSSGLEKLKFSWDGFRYFVTFLDDYTHFSMICLIKNKSDVCDAARNYIVEAESKWNTHVYKLRCDMGAEYVGNDLTDWFRERGIKIDYAPATTPQLNGRAERLNRMLMEKTRAFLFDSGLEKELWGEALSTAMYPLNRRPYATADRNPAELWYGKRLDLSNLKLFCYATNYYRLLNSEKREIKVLRDATFVESTEISATSNSSQEIIADTVSLVEETSLRLADNMEVRRNTTVLQDDVVEGYFHVIPSDHDTRKTSEMLDSLPETATEIENCNHQGRKE